MPLKVELHAHTSDDPSDRIPHSTPELIDRAAELGYQAIAITLHERQLDLAPFRAHAASRGVVLIPGVERTIEGRHVLLINFSTRAESVVTFADLALLRQAERGLVVAPHPFFVFSVCLGPVLERHADLIDAVEVNAMYTRWADLNRRGMAWAARHGKPLVGNGDVHRLAQLGTTYSLIDAAPDPDAICEAVRAGRVEVRSEPLSTGTAIAVFSDLITTRGRSEASDHATGLPASPDTGRR